MNKMESILGWLAPGAKKLKLNAQPILSRQRSKQLPISVSDSTFRLHPRSVSSVLAPKASLRRLEPPSEASCQGSPVVLWANVAVGRDMQSVFCAA